MTKHILKGTMKIGEGNSSMEELRMVHRDEKSIERMNELISNKIDEILSDNHQNKFLEGIVYMGRDFSQIDSSKPEVELMFIYNDKNFEPVELTKPEIMEILSQTGMNISIMSKPDWYYSLEGRFQDRGEHPWEFIVRQGTIIYDKTGKIKELQTDLQNDLTLDNYTLFFSNDSCKFEPPIEYIPKQYRKIKTLNSTKKVADAS